MKKILLLSPFSLLLAALALRAATPLSDVKFSGTGNELKSGAELTIKSGSTLTVEEGATVVGLSGGGGGGSGSVTSVALTAPSFLSVSGTPITSSGTLGLTLATQVANRALIGPSSGAAAAPTFRALVANDVPFALSPVFRPQAYGAALDGSADDTAPIQSAINAAAAAGGGIVYFSGIGKITSGLTLSSSAGVTLVGANRANAGLKAGTAGMRMLTITGSNVVLQGLRFDGAYTTGSKTDEYAVAIDSADKVTVRDCAFIDLKGRGIGITGGSDDCQVLDTRFSNFWAGIITISAGETPAAPQRLVVDRCQFLDGWGGDADGSGGVRLAVAIDHSSLWSDGERITNCTFDDAGEMAIELFHHHSNAVLANNVISGGEWGISVNNSKAVTVSDNAIKLFTTYGIELAGPNDFACVGNVVDGYAADGTTPTGDNGIVCIGDVDGVTGVGGTMSGNAIRGCSDRGIWVLGWIGVVVADNSIRDCNDLIAVKDSNNVLVKDNMLSEPGQHFIACENTDINAEGLRIEGNTFVGAPSDSCILIADFSSSHTWSEISIIGNDLMKADAGTYGTIDIFGLGSGARPNYTVLRNLYVVDTGNASVPDNLALTDYADNAAALAGGLVAGQLYRTGDAVKIVH